MLLVARLLLVTRLDWDLLKVVQRVSRVLDLGVDASDLVFDLLALRLVMIIKQSALVHQVAVVYDLYAQRHMCEHAVSESLQLRGRLTLP